MKVEKKMIFTKDEKTLIFDILEIIKETDEIDEMDTVENFQLILEKYSNLGDMD